MTTTDKPMTVQEVSDGYDELAQLKWDRDVAARLCASIVLDGPAFRGEARRAANTFRSLATEVDVLRGKLHAAVESAAITPFVS
jgi:hypothetical protein